MTTLSGCREKEKPCSKTFAIEFKRRASCRFRNVGLRVRVRNAGVDRVAMGLMLSPD
jgi:hypothetical protein